MITKEKVECKNCGELILREEGYEYKNGYLCECCYYEDFVACEDCGTIISIDSAKVINPHLENKKYVCPDCANNYHRCSHCESLVSSNEVWASDSDLVICNHCDEFYYICNSCRCIVHEDDVYYSDGESYCHDCYDKIGSSYSLIGFGIHTLFLSQEEIITPCNSGLINLAWNVWTQIRK